MNSSRFKNIITFFSCVLIVVFLFNKTSVMENLESLSVAVGIGYSIEQNKNNVLYKILISSVVYNENGMNETKVTIGRANTVGKTRQNRQLKDDKKFFLGSEKIYFIDEEFAKFSIRPIVDILFKNPTLNDTGYCVVCKGNSKDYLTTKIEGYDTSTEYVEGMIKTLPSYNFFANQYTIRDVFLNLDSEGKNIILPYIERTKDSFMITGVAVFKGEKLAAVLGINDSILMNVLRNDKSKGMFTIQNKSKEYINYEANVKRKVECVKEYNGYKFVINLNMVGDVVSNTLYKDMKSDTKVIKKFQEDMAKKIEAETTGFIDKMKNECKVDCLQLGSIAAAKYGRATGVDWNKIVSSSDIKVKVNVKVDKVGRGEYN